MSESIRAKLARMSQVLEDYEDGKPLPISLNDIHFLIGACSKMVGNLENLEVAYKKDIGIAAEEVDKFRKKWKEARQISVRLNSRITRYEQIITQVKNLGWWQKSGNLKKQLATLAEFEIKNGSEH